MQLPLYQRSIDSNTAALIILAYQGPTGEQLAKNLLQRQLAAAHAGSGTPAPLPSNDSILWQKRFDEIGSEKLPQVQAAMASFQAFRKSTDQQLAQLYNNRVNEVVKSTQLEHQSELTAARNAAPQP